MMRIVTLNAMSDPIDKTLRAKIQELEEALAFYAAPMTYFAIGFFPDRPCGEFMDDFSETALGMKPGRTARVALGLEK